nr:unnamed protein product [Callosobruchus chinensis]
MDARESEAFSKKPASDMLGDIINTLMARSKRDKLRWRKASTSSKYVALKKALKVLFEAHSLKLKVGQEDGELKCGEAVETAKHVIFDCPALCRRRSSYLEVVQEEGSQKSGTTLESTVALILTARSSDTVCRGRAFSGRGLDTVGGGREAWQPRPSNRSDLPDVSKDHVTGVMEVQLKLRNTSSSIVLPCAEEEARIGKLSKRREDRSLLLKIECSEEHKDATDQKNILAILALDKHKDGNGTSKRQEEWSAHESYNCHLDYRVGINVSMENVYVKGVEWKPSFPSKNVECYNELLE